MDSTDSKSPENNQTFDIRQTLKQAQSIPPMPPLDQLESLMANDATLSLMNLTDDMLLPDLDSLLKPYTCVDGSQEPVDVNMMGLASIPSSPVPASPTAKVIDTSAIFPNQNQIKGVYVEDGKKYKLQSGKKILVCLEENCKIRASYGQPGTSIPVSCKKHATSTMTDIKNKKCEHEGCSKLPSFCFPGKAVTHCKEHAVPGMNVHRCKLCEQDGCTSRSYFNYPGLKSRFCRIHALPGMVIQKSRKCEEATCNARPSYGYPGSKPARCAEHKLVGMVNTRHPRCAESGCSKWPCYALPGKAVKYCKEHAKEGMVDVQNRRCEEDGCSVRAFWGLHGQAPARCKDHILEGMVYKGGSCKEVGCKKAPRFGYPPTLPQAHASGSTSAIRGRAEYCDQHKQPGMVDLKARTCQEAGCGKPPTSNYPQFEEAAYCKSHSKEGMVSIVAKMCEFDKCRKRAYYSLPGEPAKWCKQHQEPGAELKSKKVCVSDGCRQTPLYNLPGCKPEWCAQHRAPAMVQTAGTLCSHQDCSKPPTHSKTSDGLPEFCKRHASKSMVELQEPPPKPLPLSSTPPDQLSPPPPQYPFPEDPTATSPDFSQILLHSALASQLKAGPIPIAPKPIAPKPQLIAPAVSQVVSAAAQLLMPKFQNEIAVKAIQIDNELKQAKRKQPGTDPSSLIQSMTSFPGPQIDSNGGALLQDEALKMPPAQKRKFQTPSNSDDEEETTPTSDKQPQHENQEENPEDDIGALFTNVGYPVPKSSLADLTKKQAVESVTKSPTSEDGDAYPGIAVPVKNFLPMQFPQMYQQPGGYNPFFPSFPFNPFALAPPEPLGSPHISNQFQLKPAMNPGINNEQVEQQSNITKATENKKNIPPDMKDFLNENGLSAASDLLCQAFESDMSVLLFSAQDDKVQFDKDLQNLGMSLYQRRKLNMAMRDYL